MAKKILILHDAGAAKAPLADLAARLTEQGAVVIQRECSAPYESVLDAIAEAESVLYWR